MKAIMFFLAMVLGIASLNAQTRTAIKKDELPKAITEDISKNYQGWNTLETYKVDTKGEITYAVAVKKAEGEMNLVYDKDGKFLRAEPYKSAAVQTPSNNSASDQPSSDNPRTSTDMRSRDKTKN